MKKCITKKALSALLAAILTVSVFAVCFVFSAGAEGEDTNLALGATVLNTPAYPSGNNYVGKVNDGVIGEHKKFDSKWAAFYKNGAELDNYDGKVGEIVVDFGEKKDFSSLRTHVFGTGDSGVSEMEKVEFFVSDDNKTWTSVGAVTEGLTGEGVWVEVKKAVSGRYVKYAYTKKASDTGVFMFVSECEAYGKAAAGGDTSTATSTAESTAASTAESTAASTTESTAASTATSSTGTTETGDFGVAAVVLLAVVAAGGVLAVRKCR